jgi:pimeloyl-ACP methyl ester carboxylesterase
MTLAAQTLAEVPPKQRVVLSDSSVAYRQSGAGTPLLLIHGWGGSSSHWYTSIDALASVRTCYALDLPGYGESPPLATGITVARMAEIVIEFANAMGIEKFDINGHSLGGGVAAYIAATWPERVNHLVMTSFGISGNQMEHLLLNQMFYQLDLTMNMWRPWITLWQPWWQSWMMVSQFWMAEMGYIPRLPHTIALPFFYRLPSDEQLVREGYTEFVMMDQRTSFETMISLGSPELRETLKSITVPTLLVCGRQDLVVPAPWMENAADMLPDSRLVWMEDCGHVPMIERPEIYNCLLRHFFEGDMDLPVPRPAAA